MSDNRTHPIRMTAGRTGFGRAAEPAGRSALDRLAITPPPPGETVIDESVVGAAEGREQAGGREQSGSPGHADQWGIGAAPAWLDQTRVGEADPDGFGTGDWDPDDDESESRHRVRIAPPGAIALILVGVIACAVAAYGLLRSPDATPTVAFPESAGPTAASQQGGPSQEDGVAASGTPSSAQQPVPAAAMVVSVVGLVHRPGLVRLAPRARVADAIARAGGARPGADTVSLNLAQVLNDGDQILVGYAGKQGQMSLRSSVVSSGAPAADSSGGSPSGQSTTGTTGSATTPSAGGKVNLNTATAEQLDELPGVGPVTAKAIIDWRTTHGKFTSVDQLGEVDGIGPARLAKLKDLVTV